MRITKQDFEAWWSSPVAVEFKTMLRENSDKLAHGTMNAGHCNDQVQHAIEVGRYQVTKEYLEMTYETLTGEEE